jgi:hypothetical protein
LSKTLTTDVIEKEVQDSFDLKLDVWICEHFKVLPTEQRFKDLSGRQKLILWFGCLYTPSREVMQRSFLLSKKNEERFGVDEVTADALKQSGYSKEQIEAIQDQLKKFTEKGE